MPKKTNEIMFGSDSQYLLHLCTLPSWRNVLNGVGSPV